MSSKTKQPLTEREREREKKNKPEAVGSEAAAAPPVQR